MTGIESLKAKISNIQHLIQELSSKELGPEADPENLYKKFLALRNSFGEFNKLTNAGKATPELKNKLLVLKKWLHKYDDLSPAEIAIEFLPKKYENKNVSLSPDSLRQISYFKNYIKYIVEYMENLGPKYQELKDQVNLVMEKGKTLKAHMDKFLLTDDFLPSYDLLSAEDEITGELSEVSPSKMLGTIQSILKKFHQYSSKVADKYQEVSNLLHELDEVDLGDFLNQTNRRNKLIQNLLSNLVEANKIMYQSDFPGVHAARQQYYQLIEDQVVPLLPSHIGYKVLNSIKHRKDPGKFQTALQQSLHGVKSYDPNKDPKMKFQSPHTLNYVPPSEKEPFTPAPESLEDRVNRSLRHQELAEISQRMGQPVSPEEKKKYEELWRNSSNRFGLSKLAKYYRTKII